MTTFALDMVVGAYRLIPAPVRGLWKMQGSTSHRAYGGWANFRSAGLSWFDENYFGSPGE
jgi:hypothetical protein